MKHMVAIDGSDVGISAALRARIGAGDVGLEMTEGLTARAARDRPDIRPLTEATRARFAAECRGLQERFVEQPPNVVVAADRLVARVMSEVGYPMDNLCRASRRSAGAMVAPGGIERGGGTVSQKPYA